MWPRFAGRLALLVFFASASPVMAETSSGGQDGLPPLVTDDVIKSIVDLVYGDLEPENAVATIRLRSNPVRVSTLFSAKNADALTSALEFTAKGLTNLGTIDLDITKWGNGAAKQDIIIVEDSKDRSEAVDDLFSGLESIIRSGTALRSLLPFISADRDVGENCVVFNFPTASSYKDGGSLEIHTTLVVLGNIPGNADPLNKLTHCMNKHLFAALLPASSQSTEGLDVPFPSILNEDWLNPSIEDLLILRSLYDTGDAEHRTKRDYDAYLKVWLQNVVAALRPRYDRNLFCLECS